MIDGDLRPTMVLEEPEVLAFLDRSPVFKGHVLVCTREHVVTLDVLPERLLVPLFSAVQRVQLALTSALGAQGTFVAVNNVVSQSVPHLHVHVIPRTKGDGLKGFFWPRVKYASDDERESFGARLRAAVAGETE
jgi:histidine triad (HIT) family protein